MHSSQYLIPITCFAWIQVEIVEFVHPLRKLFTNPTHPYKLVISWRNLIEIRITEFLSNLDIEHHTLKTF